MTVIQVTACISETQPALAEQKNGGGKNYIFKFCFSGNTSKKILHRHSLPRTVF
jgi:hypothetical protein